MDKIERARRVVAKLTLEDMHLLKQYIDRCLVAAIKFDETGKPEFFAEMKNAMEEFMNALKELENEA
ncbi:MAG: hypothetical protein ACPLVJ_00115 [Candidatus Bathyarchaeales archaeon]